MSALWKCISTTFGFFDVYTEHPKLRTNGQGRFTSCLGLLLSIGLALTCLLLFVPAANDYVQGKYLEQAVTSVESPTTAREMDVVTGRDIFMGISVRLKNTTEEVDITAEMANFMGLTLQQVDNTPGAKTMIRDMPTEPCPPNYFANFDSGVNLKYCWKAKDGLRVQISNLKYLIFRFQMNCKMGVACSGSIMNSVQSSFISFWQQHTYTFYFTTRYLDSTNTVRWRLNKASSFSFFETTAADNYVGIYFTNDYYYIDDSVLPNRQNRTIQLEGFMQRQLVTQIPTSYLVYYGVGLTLSPSNIANDYYRYYTKLDSIIGSIGGGVFILFIIFACVGYRLNRYQYRTHLVNQLYLHEEGGRPELAKLPCCSEASFAVYDALTPYDPQKRGDSSTFAGRLQRYRHMFQRVTLIDTGIVPMVRQSKNLRRLMEVYGTKEWANFREVLGPKAITDAPGSAQVLAPTQQKQLDLMGWNEATYNNYEDLVRRELEDQPESKNSLKNRQLLNTDAYQMVFEDHRQALSDEPSHIPVSQPRPFLQRFKQFIVFFDAFKVHPRFRSNGAFSREKSPFVGCLCILAFVLAVLLLFTAFGYFAQTKTRISLETNNLPAEEINFNITTDKKYFGMALCFYDSAGAIKNMVSQFSTYATVEMVVHKRVGTDKTETTTMLQPMGNPLDYFNDDGKILTAPYGNCYALPLGQTLQVQGSPKTQTESYFSIRVKQFCHNPSAAYCAANFAADRTNTLSILTSPMVMVLSKSLYSAPLNDFDTIWGRATLYRMRNTALNSSVYEQVNVDWMTMYRDTSIARDKGAEVRSTIGNEEFYSVSSMVLPPDNNPISYELVLRATGRQVKITEVAMKADEMFGMIGGVLLFMFFLAGVLARPYREFLQRIRIAAAAYQHRNGLQLSFFDEILFYLCPWKSLLSRRGKLGLVKSLNAESEQSFSVETIIQRTRTCMRVFREIQSEEKRNFCEVYLKQPMRLLSEVERNFANNNRIVNDRDEPLGVGRNENGSGHGSELRGAPSNMQLDAEKSHSNGNGLSIEEKFDLNNEAVPPQLDQPSRMVIIQMEDDEHIPEVYNVDDRDSGRHHLNIDRSELYNKPRTAIKKSAQNTGGFVNFFRKLLAPQNPVSRFCDLFGIEGEMTVEGKTRYGSTCGGALTAVCAALIIWAISYFAGIYVSPHNYFSTMENLRVGQLNNPTKPMSGRVAATQRNNNYTATMMNFTTGTDLRLAIGFLSGKLPGLQDVSAYMEGSNKIAQILGVQVEVDRTNRSKPVRTEQVYTFVRCPANYLNDGVSFLYEDYGVQESIEMGYCIPNGVNLDLYGDSDTDIQRWFYLSLSMVPCPSCTAAQKTTLRNNMLNFFNAYGSRLYLSDPMADRLPLTYKFQRLLFGRSSQTRNTVENVSIDCLEFVEDKELLSPPTVVRAMDYKYVQNVDMSYSYTDTNVYFKNMTFVPTNNINRYTRTYLKPNQILGMLGGFTFFIVLIFRFWVRRHNKFKMYLSIGRQLLVKESGAHELSEQGKSSSSFQPSEFSDWEVFKFSTLSFFYKRFGCMQSPRFNEAQTLLKNVQDELDLLNYIRVLNYCRNRLGNNFTAKEKAIMNMHVKHVVHPTCPLDVKDRPDNFLGKFEQFAVMHELSPHDKELVLAAVDKNPITLRHIYGSVADPLTKLPQQQLQEHQRLGVPRRNPRRLNPIQGSMTNMLNDSAVQPLE